MALYKNTTIDSTLSAVEFSEATSGNLAFFYVKPRESVDEIKNWAKEHGQELITESTVKGEHVIVTRGSQSQGEMLEALKERGDAFKPYEPTKKINLWKWRGILSMTGHPMQLASSVLAKGFDKATFGFAILNLSANLTNIFFGAQKNPDENRLHFLKERINDDLMGELPNGLPPYDAKDNRSEARNGQEEPKSLMGRAYDFMQKYSVTFGEIGLRYVGGICLVAPPNKWKAGFKALGSKGLGEAWKTWRNPDDFTRIAGSLWLAGKTIAFTAKTPDPYNDKQETAWDNFRENYAFKLSTFTEAMGALTMAGDRLFSANRRVTYKPNKYLPVPKFLHGKSSPDILGGVGGLLFALAFVMRFNAPYGVKVVNMDEVNAHLTDSLAKCPKEKIPQLMADNSAYLVEHFKEKDLHFGEVFTEMMLDIYKHHHMPPMGTEPIIQQVADAQEPSEAGNKIAKITDKAIVKKEEPASHAAKHAHLASSHVERHANAPATGAHLSA